MEVFMVDGGRKCVVVGRIVRVMQMLRSSKRSFEIVITNGLAVAWSPTRSGILPTLTSREHGIVESTRWSCGASVIDDLLCIVEIYMRGGIIGILGFSSLG